MSTRSTIKYQDVTEDGKPGFHLFTDYGFDNRTDIGLELHGVEVEVAVHPGVLGAFVSLVLPRELAEELGLVKICHE